jgi:hypothetical protein
MSKQITIDATMLDNLLRDTERAADYARLTAQQFTDARTTAYKQAKDAEWYTESARIRIKQIAADLTS